MLGGYAAFAEVPRLRARAQGSLWRHAPSLYRDVHRLLGAADWLATERGRDLRFGTDPEGAYHLLKGVFMPWELDGVLDADALREGLHALAEKDAAHLETLEDSTTRPGRQPGVGALHA